MESLLHRENLREDREDDQLVADEAGEAREQQGVNVELHGAHLLRPGLEDRAHHEPEPEQRSAGVEEKPTRAEQEHEPQVPPAVAPRAQVRRPRAAVGAERHGDLSDLHPLQRRLDHHLTCEFHAVRAQAQAVV